MSTAHSVVPQSSQPTPLKIFQLLNAYQQTEALKAAIELDLFTQIGDGGGSAAQIAAQIKADARVANVLKQALAGIYRRGNPISVHANSLCPFWEARGGGPSRRSGAGRICQHRSGQSHVD